MDKPDVKEALRKQLAELLGDFPEPPELDLRIIHKRSMHTYEEWKIQYTVETEATMPIPAGRTVPAYLLVPKLEDFSPPYPGVVCFHQCNCDCVLGKKSVVGKAPDRRDQQYGYELVDLGFVVLAPDTFHCGERNIPELREVGENRICHGLVDAYIGRKHVAKRVYDGMRAIDVLSSFDFVDKERLATVGHSLGSGDARLLMARDGRVKAGIFSGDDGTFLPLHSPRLHIGMWGELDATPNQIEEATRRFDKATKIYEDDGARDNLVFKTPLAGHYFIDDFKMEAYARLTECFGFSPYLGLIKAHRPVRLPEVLRQAQQRLRNDVESEFLEPSIDEKWTVQGNSDHLIAAFTGLLAHMAKRSSGTDAVIQIRLESTPDCYQVSYSMECDRPHLRSEAPFPSDSRRFEIVFHQHRARIATPGSSSQMIYQVSLLKADQERTASI